MNNIYFKNSICFSIYYFPFEKSLIKYVYISILNVFRNAFEGKLMSSKKPYTFHRGITKSSLEELEGATTHQRRVRGVQDEPNISSLNHQCFSSYNIVDNKGDNKHMCENVFLSEFPRLNYQNEAIGHTKSKLYDTRYNRTQISNYTKTNQNVTEEELHLGVINGTHCFYKSKDGGHVFQEQEENQNVNKRLHVDRNKDSSIDLSLNNINTNTTLMTHNKYMDFQVTNTNQCNGTEQSTREKISAFETLDEENIGRSEHHLQHFISHNDERNEESTKFQGMGNSTMKSSSVASLGKRTSDKSGIKVMFKSVPNEEGERVSPQKRKKLNTIACSLPSCNCNEYHHKEYRAENKRDEYCNDGKEWSFLTESKDILSSKEHNNANFSMKKSWCKAQHARERSPQTVNSDYNSKDYENQTISLSSSFNNDCTTTNESRTLNTDQSRQVTHSNASFIENKSSGSPTDEIWRSENWNENCGYNDQHISSKNNSEYTRNCINHAIHDGKIKRGSKNEIQPTQVKDSSTDPNEKIPANKREMEFTVLCIKGDNNINPTTPVTSVAQSAPNMSVLPNFTTSLAPPEEFLKVSPENYNYVSHQRHGNLVPSNQFTNLQQTNGLPTPLTSPTSLSMHVYSQHNLYSPPSSSTHNNIFPQQQQHQQQHSAINILKQHPPASSNLNSTNTTFLLSVPNVSPLSQTSSSIDSGYDGPGSVGSLPSSTYSAADSPVSYAHNGSNAVNLAGFPNSPWQAPEFSIAPTTIGSTSVPLQNYSDISSLQNNEQQFSASVNNDNPFLSTQEYTTSDNCRNFNVGSCSEENSFSREVYNNVSTNYCQTQTRFFDEKSVEPNNPSHLSVIQNDCSVSNSNMIDTSSYNTTSSYNINNGMEVGSNNPSSLNTQILPKIQATYLQPEPFSKDQYLLEREQNESIGPTTAHHQGSEIVSIQNDNTFLSSKVGTNSGHTGPDIPYYEKLSDVHGTHYANDEVQNLHDSDIQTIVDSLYREGFVEIDERSVDSVSNLTNYKDHNSQNISSVYDDMKLQNPKANDLEVQHIERNNPVNNFRHQTTSASTQTTVSKTLTHSDSYGSDKEVHNVEPRNLPCNLQCTNRSNSFQKSLNMDIQAPRGSSMNSTSYTSDPNCIKAATISSDLVSESVSEDCLKK